MHAESDPPLKSGAMFKTSLLGQLLKTASKADNGHAVILIQHATGNAVKRKKKGIISNFLELWYLEKGQFI